MSGRVLIGAALLLSALLVGSYIAAGGGEYQPTPTRDPCAARAWRAPSGLDPIAQQFALSALDGAACELDISREQLAIDLAEHKRGTDDPELEDAVRAGVVRAIRDAELAGELSSVVALALTEIAVRLPVDEAIAVIEDADGFIARADDVIDDAGDLVGELPEFIEGLLP